MGRKCGWATVWEYICSPTLSPVNTRASTYLCCPRPRLSCQPCIPRKDGSEWGKGEPASLSSLPQGSLQPPSLGHCPPLRPHPQPLSACDLPRPPKVCFPQEALGVSLEEMGRRDRVVGVLVQTSLTQPSPQRGRSEMQAGRQPVQVAVGVTAAGSSGALLDLF